MKESQVNLIIAQIQDEYGAEPEFLWPERYPTYCIFRHSNNKKWFALVGRIEWKSLGRDGKELVDIINLKFDNGQALDFAENTPGVYPAYHMNKKTLDYDCPGWNIVERDGDGISKEKLFINRQIRIIRLSFARISCGILGRPFCACGL